MLACQLRYSEKMRVDANFFCTVPMDDAGKVAPTKRRYGNDSVIECYKNLVSWAKTADQVGIDTMWLTEHHFQFEGYEVLPNLIMFGQHLTSVTKNLRLGQMFNVVPQWHPLRLAEDFALADIVTGGRMEFGVGRGTVPREAWSLGTVVASGDNAMSAEHDRINRDVYQPVTSPETIEYVPRVGHKAVYWLQNADSQKQKWDRYAEIREQVGTPVAPGEDRMLVINLHCAKTREKAMIKGKPGHDEFANFLSPYGRFSSYRNPDGSKVAFNHCPTVQESIDQKIQIVGSFDDAVDTIGFWRELLDLKHICFFFDYPGVSRDEMNEQMHFIADEIFPRLGEKIERRPLPNLQPLI